MHQDSRWTRAPIFRGTALLVLGVLAVALGSTGAIAGSKHTFPSLEPVSSIAAGDLGPDSYFLRMWGWGVDNGLAGLQICTRGCQAGINGSGNGQLSNARGIAIDPSGRVAVVDQYNYRIQFFSVDGAYLSQYGSSGTAQLQFGKPGDIAFDSSGNAYIADTNNQRVQVVDSTGAFVRMWGWGVDDGTSALQVCTSSCQIGIQGGGDGQLDDPSGITVDPSTGLVYVADTGNSRIQQFNQYGNYHSQFSAGGGATLSTPTDIDVDNQGNLVVLDRGNNRIVRRRASDYGLVDVWGWGVQNGEWQFQVCTSGCLIGLPGSGEGQFLSIQGVAVDRARDLIYVSDQSNHRVHVFSSAPSYLGMLGTNGTAEGQFLQMASVATDSSGHIYVTDEQNYRVQKYLVGSLDTVVVDLPPAGPAILLARPARTLDPSQ